MGFCSLMTTYCQSMHVMLRHLHDRLDIVAPRQDRITHYAWKSRREEHSGFLNFSLPRPQDYILIGHALLSQSVGLLCPSSSGSRRKTSERHLDGKPLDLVAQSLDLSGKLGSLVGSDAGADDGAADTTGAAEQSLAGDVDVRNTLVFTEQRDVQNYTQRLGVGGEDGDFAGTAVEGLGDY